MIDPLTALIGALAGAILGSFLATVIVRWPLGRGVLRGRSMCDSCGRTLGPRDLIPLVSALLSRGRCRSCGNRIDPLHGRVEAGCAIIGGMALGFAPGMGGVAWACLGWILLTLAILDWRHFWLPDALTLPLAFLGFALGPFATNVGLLDRGISAALGYAVLLIIALSYRAIRGRDGLGLGDAKLLGALGAWFGWQALPLILFCAAGSGLLIMLLMGNAKSATARAPLGTFLAIAAVPGWMLRTYLMPG